MAEIELILATTTLLGKIGFEGFTVHINDRRILKAMAAYSGFPADSFDQVFITLDKMDKIGREGVAEELLEYAALAERYSDHPVAVSLRQACPAAEHEGRVTEVREIAGHGVTALVDGHRVAVGNRRLMEAEGIASVPEVEGTAVHTAVDGVYMGAILLADRIKAEAQETIAALKACGVERIVMLTGDTETAAAAAAKELGITEYRAGLLPGDKVEQMERLLAEKRSGTIRFYRHLFSPKS
jgi:Cd2+/Zn2+-exporting ATPase